MKGEVWTISNALSLLRVVLVLPIGSLLSANEPGNKLIVTVLILFAIATDFFDGMMARRLKQVTEFGKVVDPLADKIAVGIVTIILAQLGKLPFWFVVAVVVRDVLIFLGALYVSRTRGIVLQSNQIGKWAVTVIAALLFVSIFDSPMLDTLKLILLFASTAMLLISMVSYIKRFISVLSVSTLHAS